MKQEIKKEEKEKIAFHAIVSKLKKCIPAQIILGSAAAIILYTEFGLDALIRTVLEWVLGVTIVAFIVTHVFARYRR